MLFNAVNGKGLCGSQFCALQAYSHQPIPLRLVISQLNQWADAVARRRKQCTFIGCEGSPFGSFPDCF